MEHLIELNVVLEDMTKEMHTEMDSCELEAYADCEIVSVQAINITAEDVFNALGYEPIGQDSLPTKTSQLQNDSGFLTEHQDLSDYLKIEDAPVVPVDEISANSNARHSHSNKSILDGITKMPVMEHQSLEGYIQNTDPRLSDSRTPKAHTHNKSEITDFPTSMPASDVKAWAKADSKPSYTASEVGALPDTTVIPPTVTESTVSGWGFTKNAGTYSKPSGGIPKTDLASAVQTSLGKADTALQEHQSLANYVLTTDSRLSDARTPKSHNHSKSDITDFPTIPSKTSQLQNDSGFLTSHQDVSKYLDKTSTSTNVLASRIQVGAYNTNVNNAFLHIRNVGSTSITGKNVNGACFSINADGTASFQHKTYDDNGGNARNEAVLRFSNKGIQFGLNTGNDASPTEEMYKTILTEDQVIELIDSKLGEIENGSY